MPVSPVSRYRDCPTVKAPRSRGGPLVTSLALRPTPQIEAFPDSIVHTVVGGETLDQLAYRYYGREDLWWRILDANGLYPDDPGLRVVPRLFRLQAGDRLTIPPVRTATRFPRR